MSVFSGSPLVPAGVALLPHSVHLMIAGGLPDLEGGAFVSALLLVQCTLFGLGACGGLGGRIGRRRQGHPC